MWMFESSLEIEVFLSLIPYQCPLFTFWINKYYKRHCIFFLSTCLLLMTQSVTDSYDNEIQWVRIFLQKYLLNSYHASSNAPGTENTVPKRMTFLILPFYPSRSIASFIFMPTVIAGSTKSLQCLTERCHKIASNAKGNFK